MAGDTKLLGRWGEALVAEDLRQKGHLVVAAGWHCRQGEIDIISEQGKYLVFTEVKLRKSAAFAQAREFVDRRKQQKLRTAAALYLAEHPTRRQPRFDVAEVYAPRGTETAAPQIQYIEDAF